MVCGQSNPEYVKSVAKFRNEPINAPVFESKDYDGVMMVTGVVVKKIWYKAYRKSNMLTNATYVVKVGGNTYATSEDHEETVKHGLLLRPLSGWGYKALI
jgi:hypothetical protein